MGALDAGEVWTPAEADTQKPSRRPWQEPTQPSEGYGENPATGEPFKSIPADAPKPADEAAPDSFFTGDE